MVSSRDCDVEVGWRKVGWRESGGTYVVDKASVSAAANKAAAVNQSPNLSPSLWNAVEEAGKFTQPG